LLARATVEPIFYQALHHNKLCATSRLRGRLWLILSCRENSCSSRPRWSSSFPKAVVLRGYSKGRGKREEGNASSASQVNPFVDKERANEATVAAFLARVDCPASSVAEMASCLSSSISSSLEPAGVQQLLAHPQVCITLRREAVPRHHRASWVSRRRDSYCNSEYDPL